MCEKAKVIKRLDGMKADCMKLIILGMLAQYTVYSVLTSRPLVLVTHTRQNKAFGMTLVHKIWKKLFINPKMGKEMSMSTTESVLLNFNWHIDDITSCLWLHILCTQHPLIPELPINVSLNLTRREREWFDHVECMATFVCKTSKSAVEVTWFKDKEELKAGSKYELRHIGREHILTVHELCKNDYGDYVVTIRSLRKMPDACIKIGLYATVCVFVLQLKIHNACWTRLFQIKQILTNYNEI